MKEKAGSLSFANKRKYYYKPPDYKSLVRDICK